MFGAILGSLAGGLISAVGANKASKAQQGASRDATAAQERAAAIARQDQQAGVRQADSILRGGQTNALNALASGFNGSRGYITDAYDTQAGLFQPTIDSGTAASAARDYTLGIGAKPAGYQGFDQTEYFQSQLRNGQRAIDGSAAASGGLFSGNTLRALQQSGSDLAYRSQGEYLGNLNGVSAMGQNAAGNLASAAGQQGNALAGLTSGYYGDRANVMTGTAGQRANAFAGLGNNLSNVSLGVGAAQAQGAYNVGNARAAGAVGFGNAINDGIGNALGAWQMGKASGATMPSLNVGSLGRMF